MPQVHSALGLTAHAVTFVGCPNCCFVQNRLRTRIICATTKKEVNRAQTVMHSGDRQNIEGSFGEARPASPLRSSYPVNDHAVKVGSDSVIFMAIANELDMPALSRRLLKCKSEYGPTETAAHGPVLRIVKPSSKGGAIAEAFVFPYGCVVVWGTNVDSDDFLSLIIEDALEPKATPLVDNMEYAYGQYGSVKRDVITLEARSHGEPPTAGKTGSRATLDPSLERLAISWGLAQSIKLAAFESAIRVTIENTRHLPQELAQSGQITASRREVSRLVGQLFFDRYRYHLSGDLLMTPVFFWEHDEYLPCYRRIERYLEVLERGEALNKRVKVLQDLYQLLRDELGHQNSTALELAITVMIAFEILLTLIALAKESVGSVLSACALFISLTALGWTLWMLYRRRRFSKSASRFTRPQNGVHKY